MKQLLIIFHSQSGRNQRLALHLYHAAKNYAESSCVENSSSKMITVRLLEALEVNVQDVCQASACVLVCAETFGQISGGMKTCLDSVFYPALALQENQTKQNSHAPPLNFQQGLPYQLIIDTGNDGSFCEQQLSRILKGLSAKPIQDTVFIYGEPSNEDLSNMKALAEGLVEGLALGMY